MLLRFSSSFSIVIGIGAGLIGLCLGLMLSWWSLDHKVAPFRLRLGPWSTLPEEGTAEANPYLRAFASYSGTLPLGANEGFSFLAQSDSQGKRLNAACTYQISGRRLPARFWTLTLLNPQGNLEDNPAHRRGFQSSELVYTPDFSFTIFVSSTPHAGHWIPLQQAPSSFILMLNLYEPSHLSQLLEEKLPVIQRESCGAF